MNFKNRKTNFYFERKKKKIMNVYHFFKITVLHFLFVKVPKSFDCYRFFNYTSLFFKFVF